MIIVRAKRYILVLQKRIAPLPNRNHILRRHSFTIICDIESNSLLLAHDKWRGQVASIRSIEDSRSRLSLTREDRIRYLGRNYDRR